MLQLKIFFIILVQIVASVASTMFFWAIVFNWIYDTAIISDSQNRLIIAWLLINLIIYSSAKISNNLKNEISKIVNTLQHEDNTNEKEK